MRKEKINFRIKFRYCLLFLIIFSIATSNVLAGPLDSIGNFVSCTGANFISNLITSQILNLRNLIPNLGVLGIGSVPVNDVVLNPRYQGKEYVQDIIARCAAREILTKMNQNILNVVRTAGRDGGTSFIRNWRSFILGSQYRGEDIWRGMIYIAANGDLNRGIPPLLCDGIRNSGIIKSLQPREVPNLIQSGLNRRVDSLQEYLVATKCDTIVNQKFDIFMNDFSAGGGWDTFERLLQPQNNIYGATELTLKELDKQKTIEERADINEALSGSGFTSIRGTSARGSSCVIAGFGGGCIVYKDVKTPGSIIFEGVNATTQAELAFVANADELNEVIATAIQVLLNRMLDLSNPNEGNYQIPGNVDFNSNTLPPPETFPEESPTPETPEPSPPSPPSGGQPASLLADVQAEREKYGPGPTETELGQLLNAAAWKNRAAGWGLSRKDFGEYCPSPAGPIACDILHHQPTNTLYDVLVAAGAGGASTPQWVLVPYHNNPNRPWVAPVQP